MALAANLHFVAGVRDRPNISLHRLDVGHVAHAQNIVGVAQAGVAQVGVAQVGAFSAFLVI